MKVEESVSFAHIDVDWYESVFASLKRIEPWLSNGGVIVIDDYFDWAGCKKAVDDYFLDKSSCYKFDFSSGVMIIRSITN